MADDNDESGPSNGGRKRAELLSAERRKEIAKKAAESRWSLERRLERLPKAEHGGVLRVGSLELPCFVLKDGRRLLSQSGMSASLGMTKGGTRKVAGDRVANFLAGNAIKPFVPDGLAAIPELAIRFHLPQGGGVANGYEATILTDICDVVLRARAAGAIKERYANIAARCEILLRAFAKVGIIALVDEATGYQAVRTRDALAEILEAFIAKELRPYVKTFPADYYKEMFRLRGWNFPADAHGTKRPPLVGKLTNNIVYARLAPGVLDELKRRAERREDGSLKHHHHRRLTEDVGSPKLREHLASVTTLMKVSKDWDAFMRHLDAIHTKYNHTLPLDLGDLPMAE